MALIPRSELIDLKTASAVKAVADSALDTQAEQSVAYAINTAANTGAHLVEYNRPLSDELIAKLQGKGYTVTLVSTKPSQIYVIGGF